MAEFDRLLIFRALRPDRLTVAMRSFVAGMLGKEYITSQPFDLELACQVRIDVQHCLASTKHGLMDIHKRMQTQSLNLLILTLKTAAAVLFVP